MNFTECCEAYDATAAMLVNGVKGHSVLFNELADFNDARTKFAKDLKDLSLQDALWEKARKLFAEVHAKLARSPYRPSWLISELLENRGKSQIISELQSRLPNVDPSIRSSFEHVLSKLNQLRCVEANPLCQEIAQWHLAAGKIMFVLEEMQFIDEARSCLAGAVEGAEWEMARPSFLRNMQKADCVVVFAPAWLLKYHSEEYLLRAPVTANTHLLACRHEFGGEVMLSLLDDKTSLTVVGETVHLDLAVHASYEAVPPRRESHFRLRAPHESESWESGKKVLAIPFKLGGGRGTFFCRDSKVWIVNTESIHGNHRCSGVDQIDVENLEPGDLVLMTTSGGGDMIPVVADMILGNEAAKLRETQARWKAALRIALSRTSTSEVAADLKRLGAQKATSVNLRNWCNPRTLGMENLGTDLRALLQLIGLEAELENVAGAIEKLRRAHKVAGFHLQRRLRDSLQGKDLRGLFEEGFLEIRGDGGAAKTVFLVEERGSEQEIPEEWEGEIRDVDE
jgi:hypothetical protein